MNESTMHESTYDEILRLARAAYGLASGGYHGPSHWLRVERFGLHVGERTGADLTVVRLFARLHDCCRENENHDPHHGHRAADYAASLRGSVLNLTDSQFSLLDYAMRYHNDGMTSDDLTIGSCWDADRLDLGRVGVEPDPAFLSTATGRLPDTLQWAREIQVADGVLW